MPTSLSSLIPTAAAAGFALPTIIPTSTRNFPLSIPSVSQFPSPQFPTIVVINGSESAWTIAAAEVFLYGAYLVLFGFYLHVLRTGGMAKHRFLNISTISLFILCTAHCALVLNIPRLRTRLDARIAAGDVEGSDKLTAEQSHLVFATNAVYVTSNVIADSIFIFRCYAIWNSRRKIIILPTLLTVAVAAIGCANVILAFIPPTFYNLLPGTLFDVSIVLSLVTTVVLIGLTVGRIWWLARAAREVMGPKVAKRYHTACAMILESGAIYGVGGVGYLILGFVSMNSTANYDITTSGAILGQLVGIAPTIIAVRVRLGYSVKSEDSFMTSIPRLRPPAQKPAMRSLQSVEERVVYIHPARVQQDMV
ncbi:hypothetical protein FB451DRAFT_413242 [Mycena latifolia]|nr:hypothetical protein FB451DRAFT_413242 [Mycena latifolia]